MSKNTTENDKNDAVGGRVDPVVRFSAYSMLFCAFSAMIILRFKNADMSETRLFIEFWYAWLSIIGLVFLSAYLLIEKRI